MTVLGLYYKEASQNHMKFYLILKFKIKLMGDIYPLNAEAIIGKLTISVQHHSFNQFYVSKFVA